MTKLGQVPFDSNKMLIISLIIIATVFYCRPVDSPGFIIGAQTEDKKCEYNYWTNK